MVRSAQAQPQDSGRVVARFEIRFRRFLDPDGNAADDLPPFAKAADQIVPMYQTMMLTRMVDERAVAMQRTGQLGTYASSLGQEAVAVGVGAAMHNEDVLLPTYRELGAQLWRGVALEQPLRYWGGDERGSDITGPRKDFPPCIPIATHAPHAVGVAMAMQMRGERRVAVCVLGDGATSKGDFYEAINAAGVWHLPLVFVVNNNRWAISVPLAKQTAAETLAQKAIAGGIAGEQIDGNDVIVVRDAVEQAVEKARSGGGPSLVEALTYRLSDHTTADDATRYRSDDEVSAQWKNDPLARLRTYISNQGWWQKDDEEALIESCRSRIETARDAYLATPPQPATAMFDFLFESLPAAMVAQRAIEEADTSA